MTTQEAKANRLIMFIGTLEKAIESWELLDEFERRVMLMEKGL